MARNVGLKLLAHLNTEHFGSKNKKSKWPVKKTKGNKILGGPDPWYNRGVPAKACKSFLFTESSLLIKIQNTYMILRSHLQFNDTLVAVDSKNINRVPEGCKVIFLWYENEVCI